MSKKAFFIDIDGTITCANKGLVHMTDKTKYAIEQLAKDNYVFISSGRCKALLPEELLELENVGYLTTNGAYGEINGEAFHSILMDDYKLDELRKYCNLKGYCYIYERQECIYVGGNTDLYDDFVSSWSMVASDQKEDNGEKGIYLVMVICHNLDECNEFQKEQEKNFDVRKHGGFNSFDVGSLGINKGVSVKKVIEHFDVDFKDTYAFGDGLNDLEMIEGVKHGVAMGNGHPDLKKVASEVCGHVLDDGFYHYLVDKNLIKPM